MREWRGHGGAPAGSSTQAASAWDVPDGVVCWLTSERYRRWWDAGLRGCGAGGLADSGFGGGWAGRDALFADVVVRAGFRLAGRSSLTVPGVPLPTRLAGCRRFWPAPSVARNGSARWVYLPGSLPWAGVAAHARDRPGPRAGAFGQGPAVRPGRFGDQGSSHRHGVSARLGPAEPVGDQAHELGESGPSGGNV